MLSGEVVRVLIEQALDVATGSLEGIAAETGISYVTLWSWKVGRRNPSPQNLAALADVLDRRGGELRGLAKQLRQATPGRTLHNE